MTVIFAISMQYASKELVGVELDIKEMDFNVKKVRINSFSLQ